MRSLTRADVVLLALTAGALVLLAVRAADSPGVAIEVRDPAPGIDEIRVHVDGAVREPGVVTVPPGGRVADAVALAGGFAEDASPAALNLARRVTDEERIEVPREGTAALLDLNRASVAELEALPGIGPVYAGRIVEAREAARFVSSDDLVDRDVIPPGVYEQIRDRVATP